MKSGGYRKVITILIILLAAAALVAACLGRYSFDPRETMGVLAYKLGLRDTVNPKMVTILRVIRLPRVCGAMLIGAMLSVSGAIYQVNFQNPLVSPDILGVSSGAALGAALAIILGLNMLYRQLFAFAFGLCTVLLSTAIPKLLRNASNMMLVLSGMIVGGFATSIVSILKFVAEEGSDLASIVYWQMGSIASLKNYELLSVLPIGLGGIGVMLLLSWRLNIVSFGEVEAKTLGVNIKALRAGIILCASLLTASAVSISGTIGWIGLVIPHLGRLLVGSDNTRCLPVTALLGALFMLFIDTLARTLFTLEIPLSILTGIIGAPSFAVLLWRQRTIVQ